MSYWLLLLSNSVSAILRERARGGRRVVGYREKEIGM